MTFYDGSHILVLKYSIIRESSFENPWISELFVIGEIGWKLKCYRVAGRLHFYLWTISDVVENPHRPSHISMTLQKLDGGLNQFICHCTKEAENSHSLSLFEDKSLYVMNDEFIYKIETKVIEKQENDHCFQSLGMNIKGS